MDVLMGFIVLTGPLFLLVIFAVVAIVGVFVLRKKVSGTKKRWLGGLSIFGIAFFILFGDEIIGRMYLGYLCENEAEMKVYNTVKLPAKYWNEDGSPKFITTNGNLDVRMFGNHFKWKIVKENHIDFIFKIDKETWMYIDTVTNKNIGKQITFTRYFGWLNKFSPAPNDSESCRDVLIRKYGKDNYFKKYYDDNKKFILNIMER